MQWLITGSKGGGKTYYAVNKILYPVWKKGTDIKSNTILYFEDRIRKCGTNIIDNPKNFTWWEHLGRWFRLKTKPIFFFFIDFSKGEYDPQDYQFFRRNWNLIKDSLYRWLHYVHKRGRISYFSDITETVGSYNCIVFIDEGSEEMDARNWESLPEEFTRACRQSRKMGLDLVVTTQEIGQVDLNYRRLIQEWIECKMTWLHIWSDPIIIGRMKAMTKPLSDMQFSETSITINTEEEEEQKTLSVKPFWITIFRRMRYDTNYQVGFSEHKIVNISVINNSNTQTKWAIVPKKTSYRELLTEIAQMEKANA